MQITNAAKVNIHYLRKIRLGGILSMEILFEGVCLL